MLTQIMIEISANKGSVISKYIAINISSSTCLRLVHSLKLSVDAQISHLGIDDWALRKGCSYGTALVDMDTGRIIDLLPGRDGDSLSEWLSAQEEIKTVNRDRAGSYASVVSKTHPEAEQIADRFHLIKNLSEHVEAIIFSNSTLINKMISQGKAICDAVKPHRNSRLFDIAKSKLAMGYSQTKVAKDIGLSRYTIWKYAHSDSFPKSSRRTNIFDKFKHLIEKELAAGVSLSKIHKIIVKEGYKGARSNFYTHFGDKNGKNPFEKVISMKALSKHMFSKDIGRITNKIERNQIAFLSEKLTWIVPLNKLCSSFSELLKNGNKTLLDKWLADAEKLNIKRLCRFVDGIRKDYQAVLNAVTHSSSSGVIEGNINRLKCIKRQMYGRASIELLKRKVILATSG
jgi:transcriptional regulator with XRE-family HTH domain